MGMFFFFLGKIYLDSLKKEKNHDMISIDLFKKNKSGIIISERGNFFVFKKR